MTIIEINGATQIQSIIASSLVVIYINADSNLFPNNFNIANQSNININSRNAALL